MNRKQFLLSALATTLPVNRIAGQPTPYPQFDTAREHNKASDALHILIENTEDRVMAVAEATPPEAYGFAPSTALFAANTHATYAGVRTFAGQLAHLAGGNYYFFAPVLRLAMPFSQAKLDEAKTKSQAVLVARESFAFGQRAADAITPETAFNAVPGHECIETPVTLLLPG